MRFDSRFAVNDSVLALGEPAVVVGVRFSESKVTYDVNLSAGGETLRDVDSTFVFARLLGA